MRWAIGIAVVALIAIAAWFARPRSEPSGVDARATAPGVAAAATTELAATSESIAAHPVREAVVEPHVGAGSAPSERSILRGRLLNASGLPIAGARVGPTNGLAPPNHGPSLTGADGRFELEIASSSWGFAEQQRSARSVELATRAPNCLQRRTIALADDWWGRTTEIGDWFVADELVLARVRVLDSRGAVLDPMEVDLDKQVERQPAPQGPFESRFVRSLENEAEFRSIEWPVRLELRARLAWSAAAPWSTVDPLGALVELKLEPGGGARGSVVADAEFGVSRVVVRLQPLDPDSDDRVEAPMRVLPTDETRGEWVTVGLAPGRWRAWCLNAIDGAVLDDREVPEVRPGVIADGGEIDLRGRVVRWELTLRSTAGESIERGRYALAYREDLERSDGPWAHGSVSYGRAVLYTLRSSMQLFAWAPGYRPALLTGMPEDREVRLEPGWPGWLELPETASAVELEWLAKPPRPLRPLCIPIEQPRVGRLQPIVFPGAGVYRVRNADGAWIGREFYVRDGGQEEPIRVIR